MALRASTIISAKCPCPEARSDSMKLCKVLPSPLHRKESSLDTWLWRPLSSCKWKRFGRLWDTIKTWNMYIHANSTNSIVDKRAAFNIDKLDWMQWEDLPTLSLTDIQQHEKIGSAWVYQEIGIISLICDIWLNVPQNTTKAVTDVLVSAHIWTDMNTMLTGKLRDLYAHNFFLLFVCCFTAL